MSTYLLPKTIIKQIDKFRKHCLWRGSNANNRKPLKAAWPMVCVPKEEGGLGVLNLQTHMDNPERCHLQKHTGFNPTLQIHLQGRVCSSYSKSKRKISTANRFMATSLCVIFLFFLCFLFLSLETLSWICLL